jgi:hypothetical protein
MKKVTIIIVSLIIVIIIIGKIRNNNFEPNKTELLEVIVMNELELINTIELDFEKRNYDEVKKYVSFLAKEYPNSSKNIDFKILIQHIQDEEKADKERHAERARLADLSNTGMWSNGFYVDSFGERTKNGYIANTNMIKGVFSNTATTNSKLNVDFIIGSSNDISIKLFEYAGNNPVKSSYSILYSIKVQDKDGDRVTLHGFNSSDRIKLEKKDAKKLHNIFLKGGNVKFRIVNVDTKTTTYAFDIKNTNRYANAHLKLPQ